MATPKKPMGIQYEPDGRPYTWVGDTDRKSYISPVAMGTGSRPTQGGGILKTDYGGNNNNGKWERGTDWGNVASLGVGGALVAPFIAPAIGGMFGGGGGASAAGAGLSEASIPTTLGMTGTELASAGLPGALAGSAAATAATPAASAAGGAGVGAKVGGMGLGKMLGLSGIGEGMDLLGGWLGQKMGVDEKPRQSFAGKKGSNGVSVDPTEVYSQGLGLLQGLIPTMKDNMSKPVNLRNSFVQSVPGLKGIDPGLVRMRKTAQDNGDFEEASFLLKMLGL